MFQEGEKVILISGYGTKSIHTVKRVTSKQAILHVRNGAGTNIDMRFDRNTGSQIPRDTWRSSRIVPASDESIAQVQAAQHRARILKRIGEVDWRSVPTVTLDTVAAILDQLATLEMDEATASEAKEA